MRRWVWSIGLLAMILIPGISNAKPSKKSDVGFASLKFTQPTIDEDLRQKIWRRLVELLGHRAGLGAGKGIKYSVELSSRQDYAKRNRLRFVVEITVEAADPAMSQGWSATVGLFDIKNPAQGTQELRSACENCDLTSFLVTELPALVDEVGRAMRPEAQ